MSTHALITKFPPQPVAKLKSAQATAAFVPQLRAQMRSALKTTLPTVEQIELTEIGGSDATH